MQKYDEFLKKFEHKKTTDDCYTPTEVYEVVKNWAVTEYDLQNYNIIRPFYPGGDYENYNYRENDIVIDNPPFSIISKICDFYLKNNIKFFLFAPARTIFTSRNSLKRCTIFINSKVIYENGANVPTAFTTNLEKDIIARTAPDLSNSLNQIYEKVKKPKKLPKYRYPPEIITGAMLQKYCKLNISFEIKNNECIFVNFLEEQKAFKKTIFGGGLLLSQKATKKHFEILSHLEKKQNNFIQWNLSENEKALSCSLDNNS